jgi:hypothetical protein
MCACSGSSPHHARRPRCSPTRTTAARSCRCLPGLHHARGLRCSSSRITSASHPAVAYLAVLPRPALPYIISSSTTSQGSSPWPPKSWLAPLLLLPTTVSASPSSQSHFLRGTWLHSALAIFAIALSCSHVLGCFSLCLLSVRLYALSANWGASLSLFLLRLSTVSAHF